MTAAGTVAALALGAIGSTAAGEEPAACVYVSVPLYKDLYVWDVHARGTSCEVATEVARSYQSALWHVWHAGGAASFTPHIRADRQWWACTTVAPLVNDHFNVECSPVTEYGVMTDHLAASLFRFRPRLPLPT